LFVSSLGWASVFCESWLWLLGKIEMDGPRIGLYVLFWVLAIFGGLQSMGKRTPR
jgi:hypothetical protein